MEAVPATSGVRPTVRLAAGLVIGQVLLVAVIGWVTFTCADKHPGGKSPAVDQLAAPPAVIPPPPVVPAPSRSATPGPAASTSTSNPGRTRTVDPGLPAAPRSSSRSSPSAFGAAAGGNSAVPVVPPAPPTATPPLTLVPTTDSPALASPTPSTSSTPPPVLAGHLCTQIFALALAADGSTVRCLPAHGHQLRWKIV